MTRLPRLTFFIPFAGCRSRCVYCNQSVITGHGDESAWDVLALLTEQLRQITHPVEMCFFGGSFARLEDRLFEAFLSAVHQAPRGSSLRFSTYPTDLLDETKRKMLDELNISCIELGVPSLDNRVLQACGREESRETVRDALLLLKEHGYPLGVQVMTGLPFQTEESVLDDLAQLAQVKGVQEWDLRIYPCLVLRNTQLESMYRSGAYSPQTLREALNTVGKVLLLAEDFQFNVIRTGLHSGTYLESNLIAGPWHPAFGELAASVAIVERMKKKHQIYDPIWIFPSTQNSKFFGHKRFGARLLMEALHISEKECLSRLQFI